MGDVWLNMPHLFTPSLSVVPTPLQEKGRAMAFLFTCILIIIHFMTNIICMVMPSIDFPCIFLPQYIPMKECRKEEWNAFNNSYNNSGIKRPGSKRV